MKKISLVAILITFVLSIFAGLYFFAFVEKRPVPSVSAEHASPSEPPITSGVVVPAAEKRPLYNYDAETVNSLIIVKDAASADTFLDVISALKERNEGKLIEILLEKSDGEKSPLTDLFGTSAKILSPDTSYRLLLTHDAGIVSSSLIVDIVDAEKTRKDLRAHEDTLIKESAPLYLGAPIIGSPSPFKESIFRGHTVRYANILESSPFSFDYVVTDTHLIIATSQKALQKTLTAHVPEKIVSEKAWKPFGNITLSPDRLLKGPGLNVDSLAFWQKPGTTHVSLFVSAKTNDLIEIWDTPFAQDPTSVMQLESKPNGIAVDSDRNLLLIADPDKQYVHKYTLPSRERIGSIGKGNIEEGETNLAIHTVRSGEKTLFVSDNKRVTSFNLDTGIKGTRITPSVEEIEEVLVDDYHRVLYIPDEQGSASKKHAGGAILSYHADGNTYTRGGKSIFGQGLFRGDAEGVALYRCRNENSVDTGSGLIIFTDQVPGPENRFLFFDRESWQHMGALTLSTITETDGIAVYDAPVPGYPAGIFAAVHADTFTAIIGLDKILNKANLNCGTI